MGSGLLSRSGEAVAINKDLVTQDQTPSPHPRGPNSSPRPRRKSRHETMRRIHARLSSPCSRSVSGSKVLKQAMCLSNQREVSMNCASNKIGCMPTSKRLSEMPHDDHKMPCEAGESQGRMETTRGAATHLTISQPNGYYAALGHRLSHRLYYTRLAQRVFDQRRTVAQIWPSRCFLYKFQTYRNASQSTSQHFRMHILSDAGLGRPTYASGGKT